MELDWRQPWYAPWRPWGEPAAASVSLGAGVAQALNASGPMPVRFVPAAALPAGQAYERFIFDTAQVPTREGLHDFFNGLVWLHCPQTKRRLNALQAGEIAAHGVGSVRGALRDALTLFDENAALLQAPPALWDALRARDWQRLFVTERALWARARLVLFGHALLEKLAVPYKSITAHVFTEPVPEALGDELAAWDDWLASQLDASAMARKPFTPLPVLGVPGWWAANADPAFYADAAVFRPPRAGTGA